MPTAKIEITALELIALNKLQLVAMALASKFDGPGQARRELEALAGVLRDVLTRAEIANATAPERSAMDLPARDD